LNPVSFTLSTCSTLSTLVSPLIELSSKHQNSHESFQASGGFFEFVPFTLQRQCFLYMSICLMVVIGILTVHIKKVGEDEITEFTNSNL
jgi:hypothetical protein